MTAPMRLMRAAVLSSARTFELREVAVPHPALGQVLVRMEGTGICGSNLEPWRGRPWFRYPFDPGAGGHEGWGTVDVVGEGVRDFRPGDRVAGMTSRSFAEFEVVPAAGLVRLPPALDGRPCPGEALGCALNIFRRSRIASGERVAVLGVGFLGALLVQMASRRGARVLAASRRPYSLRLACDMGAAETVLLGGSDAAAAELARAEGSLFDCVIEAAGAQVTLDLASRWTREGGRLVIAGYHQDGPRNVDMQLWNWRALDIVNAHERDLRKNRAAMADAVQWVVSRDLDPAPLYSHAFPLERIDEAFRCLDERPDGFAKALIVMQ